MSQPYNPYIGQIPGQQPTTPQTWLPGNQNVTLPYVTPAPKQTIFGKVVQNESQITPNDVPMDGTIAMFPLQDFSKIIAKQWTPNGLIQTLEYLPANTKDDNPTVTLDEVMSHMDERLDQIEDLFTKPNQVMKKGDNNAKSA
jgi:hypothetical protein